MGKRKDNIMSWFAEDDRDWGTIVDEAYDLQVEEELERKVKENER